MHRDTPEAKDEIKFSEDQQSAVMKPDKGGKKILLSQPDLKKAKEHRKSDIIELNSENISSMHSDKQLS